MEGVAREIRLVARPQGFPGEDLFEVAETSIPDPAEGQLLIRNAYFSVDPYMRPRMNDVRSYVAPYTLGEAMTGGAVGRVARVAERAYAEGDWVLHQLGWREWALSDGSALRRLDPTVAPVSTALGVLGMPGFTAWYGSSCSGARRRVRLCSSQAPPVRSEAPPGRWLDRGLPRDRQRGLEEKLDWCGELGFDAVFNYREQSPRDALAELAPDGIDIYFDNVGGDHLEAAIGALRTHGRVVACGLDLSLQRRRADGRPRNMFMVVTKRLRLQGYIISDHYDRYPGVHRAGRRLGARRAAPVPRDRRRRDRECAARVPRAPPRREHREDARQGRPGADAPIADSESAPRCGIGLPTVVSTPLVG